MLMPLSFDQPDFSMLDIDIRYRRIAVIIFGRSTQALKIAYLTFTYLSARSF